MRNLMNQLIQPDSLNSYDLTYLENPKFKNWSIFKDTAQLIGRYCETVRPKNIVEFGTGLSTLIFAHEAFKGHVHNVWTIDHFTDFPGHPQKTIEEKYPDQRIRFECFPTKRRYMAGKLFEFYSLPDSYFEKTQHIDLVFIDGPPFYYNHGREAALYWIYPYLSDNAVILMDDGERIQMEQRYLKSWKSYFNGNIDCQLYVEEFGKGLCCAWKTGRNNPVHPFPFQERVRYSWKSLAFTRYLKAFIKDILGIDRTVPKVH